MWRSASRSTSWKQPGWPAQRHSHLPRACAATDRAGKSAAALSRTPARSPAAKRRRRASSTTRWRRVPAAAPSWSSPCATCASSWPTAPPQERPCPDPLPRPLSAPTRCSSPALPQPLHTGIKRWLSLLYSAPRNAQPQRFSQRDDADRPGQAQIRNFSIIAHIDHGKSTLADRLMEYTGALSDREKQDQFLDKMELERERGITIKAQTVRLAYRAKDGLKYQFNLIDTPGHVDFHYEVSRSLAAMRGRCWSSMPRRGYRRRRWPTSTSRSTTTWRSSRFSTRSTCRPPTPSAFASRSKRSSASMPRAPCRYRPRMAAAYPSFSKRLCSTSHRRSATRAPLQALIFDSWYDNYRGVVTQVRIKAGTLRVGDKILLKATGKTYEVLGLGVF